MDYTPTPPQVQAPKSEYLLVNDVTGAPPPKRGSQILTAIKYDENGKKKEIKFKVPYPPKDNCKKCGSRGYVGFEVGTDDIVPCRKCYPLR